MNEKISLIEHIRSNFVAASISNFNTSFSNVNKRKKVWWFNVAVEKFENEVNLLLQGEEKVIWIQLPKNFVTNMASKFKIRKDKNAVDLEISADRNYLYLKDVKSGGTYFDFKPYIKEEFKF